VRPIIGINADVRARPDPHLYLKAPYIEAVRRAGGIPVVLPALQGEELEGALDRIDALVLTGGDDVDTRELGVALHPAADLMDPRRQRSDLALARLVLERSTPVLGICLGMQELAIAAGAALHQHLPDAGYPGLLNHRQSHPVTVARGSRLAAIVGAEAFDVVSNHHQAIERVPAPFCEVARAPDGVIEAFELPGDRYFVGVQWHPERAPAAPETRALFASLVNAAAVAAR
jgi:gamma-glutamyl-gamma-aminobutyrate hydrolase PuuD